MDFFNKVQLNNKHLAKSAVKNVKRKFKIFINK